MLCSALGGCGYHCRECQAAKGSAGNRTLNPSTLSRQTTLKNWCDSRFTTEPNHLPAFSRACLTAALSSVYITHIAANQLAHFRKPSPAGCRSTSALRREVLSSNDRVWGTSVFAPSTRRMIRSVGILAQTSHDMYGREDPCTHHQADFSGVVQLWQLSRATPISCMAPV